MSNELPSPTPEKGGNTQPAANATGKKECKPKKKIIPFKMFKLFISRLTVTDWVAFGVDAYVILWIWSDLVGCHDFNRLCFLVPCLFIAHGVACYYLSKLFHIKKIAGLIWVVLGILTAGVAFKNSRPELITPTVSPDVIQLHDGEWEINTPVAIFNPNNFPVYSILMAVMIDGNNVPADSVEVKRDRTPNAGIVENQPYGIYVGRMNVREKGKSIPQVIIIAIGEIDPQGTISFYFKGTAKVKSSATLSVYHCSKTEQIQTQTIDGGTEARIPFVAPVTIDQVQAEFQPVPN